jgi:hypothetical protein
MSGENGFGAKQEKVRGLPPEFIENSISEVQSWVWELAPSI